ncbi:MAG: hypothetical protein HC929_13345 [Leptolyngbyaceae cyanobacterium SM2_5_2]|nr:hypothetical protein [Leptolyngbyaceae cyanobacterium SM2_5_2]
MVLKNETRRTKQEEQAWCADFLRIQAVLTTGSVATELTQNILLGLI